MPIMDQESSISDLPPPVLNEHNYNPQAYQRVGRACQIRRLIGKNSSVNRQSSWSPASLIAVPRNRPNKVLVAFVRSHVS
jgi:hypothetical protein